MAATSGFLVPPTWGRSGCSQKRVQATTSAPSASNVSVADGTRLTTRTRQYPELLPEPSAASGQQSRTVSGSAEELALLVLELLVGQRAAVAHALQLLQLGGDVDGQSPGAGPAEHAVLVLLHLRVDEVLHLVRVADVGEPLPALLGARLDEQVAGPEDAAR